jgi:hypothetical protein
LQQRTARGLLLEGAVIVASILLAFAPDAAWDRLQAGSEERLMLEHPEGQVGPRLRRSKAKPRPRERRLQWGGRRGRDPIGIRRFAGSPATRTGKTPEAGPGG